MPRSSCSTRLWDQAELLGFLWDKRAAALSCQLEGQRNSFQQDRWIQSNCLNVSHRAVVGTLLLTEIFNRLMALARLLEP